MTAQAPGQARRRALLALAAAFGTSVFLAVVSALAAPSAPRDAARTGDLVWPAFSGGADDIAQIKVTLADGGYTLRRLETGAWGMAEADDFPVRADRLSTLAEALTSLRWGEAKTRDPAKHDRIGLGDPRQGGAGALLEAASADGGKTAELVSGRRDDTVYGRRPGEDRTFRLRGELPPLYTRQGWLDLDILDMRPEAVARADLADGEGERLALSRPRGGGLRGFKPSGPDTGDELVHSLAASGPALALARFAPVDVKRASRLSTPPVARHVTVTYDDLEVEALAYREPDGTYVTLRAAETGPAAERAKVINARVRGWAFELAELDWRDFATPIRNIVQRAPEPGIELDLDPSE